jgi:hypothetical protein
MSYRPAYAFGRGLAVHAQWLSDPVEHDYPAAQDYLELTHSPTDAAAIVERLRAATTVTKKAKDIIRASRLPLLGVDNKHVEHNIGKITEGTPLAPILLVRGEPLVIADGYHRACAVYHASEDTDVACRIVGLDDPLPIAAAAREAYGQGWAETGGPMTERVKAGCVAAVEHAVEHADDPSILETTLQFGKLEGTWATVFDRRVGLYEQHTTAVADAWSAWAKDLDTEAMVRAFRDGQRLDESTDTQKREDAAIALALAYLIKLRRDARDTGFQSVIDTIEAALRSGEAEGQAGAIAVAASKLGHTTIAFDQAYTNVLAELDDADRYARQAASAADDILAGAATNIGRRLAASAAEGDSAADMFTTARPDDPAAAAYYTDLAVGKAITAGMLTVFAAIGLNTVNFVTAGDGKVCAVCGGYEDDNPWPLLTVPHPAIHGHCRCTLEPAGPIESLGRFASYLTGEGE